MICTTWDEFMENRWDGHPMWGCVLTNGLHVYDDDGRYPTSPWLRLRDYCLSNRLKIESIYLRFRSHYEHLPKAESYCFIKSALGQWGSTQTIHYYNIGLCNQNQLMMYKYKVPELILDSKELRSIDLYKDLLI